MTFSIGDILIKMDCRATADTQFTRHHVMLVVGVSPKGNPIIIHLMGAPHNKLVYEELHRGKDLNLLSFNWPAETKELIYTVAMTCFQSQKFIMTNEIIQKQRLDVSAFRPDCHYQSKTKLCALHAAFSQTEAATQAIFVPNPEKLVVMSCHQWVLSVIHYACRQTNQPIPNGLCIPPHLSWADRLYYAALNDEKATCVTVKYLPVEPPTASKKSSSKQELPIQKKNPILILGFLSQKHPIKEGEIGANVTVDTALQTTFN